MPDKLKKFSDYLHSYDPLMIGSLRLHYYKV